MQKLRMAEESAITNITSPTADGMSKITANQSGVNDADIPEMTEIDSESTE